MSTTLSTNNIWKGISSWIFAVEFLITNLDKQELKSDPWHNPTPIGRWSLILIIAPYTCLIGFFNRVLSCAFLLFSVVNDLSERLPFCLMVAVYKEILFSRLPLRQLSSPPTCCPLSASGTASSTYASTYVHIINSWLNACVVHMLLWWICKCRSIVVINVYWGTGSLGKPVIVNFMIRQIQGIIMLWHLFILQ